MTTLFYLLGYLALAAFIVLAVTKIQGYLKASPLHVRWEIYPVPHEGKKAQYGGSFMETSNWWTKPRHIEHIWDIVGIFKEVLLLEATFKHNHSLWFRTYPFHFGLYMLMGGIIILACTVLCGMLGASPIWGSVQEMGGIVTFVHNVLSAVLLIGAFGLVGGGIALIQRRRTDAGLKVYTTKEHYLNIGVFVLFGLCTLAAWAFNADYVTMAATFMHNFFTFTFEPIDSFFFTVSMLCGFFVMIWIPITNMQHLLLKYFMYHDIRWGDKPLQESKQDQDTIVNELLKYKVTWSAEHIAGDGNPKTWLDVATFAGSKK